MKTKKYLDRNKYVDKGIEVAEIVYKYYVGRYQLSNFMSAEDLDDLRQECMVEMLSTLNRYDPSKARVNTFLTHRLRGFIKDYLKKQSKARKFTSKYIIEVMNDSPYDVFSASQEKISILLSNLNVSDKKIKELHINFTNEEDLHDIIEILPSLSEDKIFIILSYYLQEKTIKEITEDLGFSLDSNYVYKLKKEAISHLKNKIKEKRKSNVDKY